MGLFDRSKKNEDKAAALYAKYGLEDLDPQYAEAVKKISTDLAGSGLSQFGATLANDNKAMLRAQTQYTKAIMEQNFIIIRQLDQLIKIFQE